MSTRFSDDAFLDRWGPAWTDPDVAQLLAFYAPDARYRDVGSDLTFVGHAEIERFQHYMYKFAPDSRVEFHSAHGDAAGFAAEWTWSGTARGPLVVRGERFPATGVSFSVPGIAYCTLSGDGRIATHDDYYDMFDLVHQIQSAERAAWRDQRLTKHRR